MSFEQIKELKVKYAHSKSCVRNHDRYLNRGRMPDLQVETAQSVLKMHEDRQILGLETARSKLEFNLAK